MINPRVFQIWNDMRWEQDRYDMLDIANYYFSNKARVKRIKNRKRK